MKTLSCYAKNIAMYLVACLVLLISECSMGQPVSFASHAPTKPTMANDSSSSIIANGSMEEVRDDHPSWPAHWSGDPGEGFSFDSEPLPDGHTNHFLRLDCIHSGELSLRYFSYPLPAAAHAVEFSWRARVIGLRKGEKDWFDAQMIFHFVGADGKDLPVAQPDPTHFWQDTRGWTRQTRSFLLPKGTRALAVLPALFRVAAGTMDIDDFSLRMVAPEPLLEAQSAAARQEAAMRVPRENPDPAKFPSPLHVENNLLLNDKGEAVWLQGVGTCGYESLPNDPHVHRTIVVAIEEWHANVFRLPVREDYWFGRSDYQDDGGAAYREAIDQAVTLCANRGAYLVLDLARYRAPAERHRQFWLDAARRYANHPAVLFDLFNEPHGVSWKVWRDGGFVEDPDAAEIDESAFLSDAEKKANRGFQSVGMQGLLDAVRSTGAKNVAVVAGNGWANDLSGVLDGYALSDSDGDGIVYSWHAYHWHKDWAKILPVLDRHPVFLGETGAAPREEMDFIPYEWKEDPYSFVPDLLGFLQQYRIHWSGWSLHPQAAPRMVLDWDYTPTPYWGAFAKEALAGKAFPLKRMR